MWVSDAWRFSGGRQDEAAPFGVERLAGPVELVGGEGQAAFEHDLLTLANEHNTSTTGALCIPSEYLEVVAKTK